MTLPIVPASRPKLEHADALTLIGAAGVPVIQCALLGIRGYYRDTMGAPGVNDRGLYDDAIMVVADSTYATFNANTDPSVTRKGVAVLDTGVWLYKRGLHGITRGNPYPAFVQAGEVAVSRDAANRERGWFGINIHRGGRTTTSSIGCQTIWPEQWPAFYALATAEMQRRGQTTIKYVLINEDGRRP